MDESKYKKNLLDKIEWCRAKIIVIKQISAELDIDYSEDILYKALESRKKMLVSLLNDLVD